MKAQTVTIQNETGLHARPASIFVSTASKFKSAINVQKGEKNINAKSVLAVLSLGITKGTEVTITADGADEEEAISKLVALVETGFGEK